MSVDRLSEEDRLMLRAGEVWPQHVAALVLLDGDALLDATGGLRIDAIREAVASRLHLVPRFRQRLHEPRRGLGGPLWVDAPDFDIAHHVRARRVAPPGTEAELLAAIEQLRRLPLHTSRPLWDMWFVTGLPDRRVGLFMRMHHAIADGMAAMATVGAFLDIAADAVVGPAVPWTPAPPPRPAELLADNITRRIKGLAGAARALLRPRATLRAARDALPGARELVAEEPGSKTSLDRLVGADRRHALVRTKVEEVKAIARDHGATANDVLLALTAGGVRAVLQSRGEAIEGVTIRVYVPVSLRRGSARAGPARGNLIGQMAVPLQLGEADPGRRLRGIAAETASRKRRRRTNLGRWFRGGLETRLLLKAINRQRVNVTTAILRGPDTERFFAGARLVEVYPILPLIGRVALGVGALSYAGTFEIGITGDRDAYPDLDVFAAGVRSELEALGQGIADVSSVSSISA